jgi:hypothetical protein
MEFFCDPQLKELKNSSIMKAERIALAKADTLSQAGPFHLLVLPNMWRHQHLQFDMVSCRILR